MQPGQYHYDLLAQIYGAQDRRIRNLRTRKKKANRVHQALVLPNNSITGEQNVEDDEELKDPSPKEVRLYTDFVTALETISCDEWNESRPDNNQATIVESNELGEVCELEFGEDYFVQVRKLLYFDGWDKDPDESDD